MTYCDKERAMPAHKTSTTTDAGPVSTGFQENGTMRAHWVEPPGTIAPFGYLTPQDAFGDVERGSPLPYTLPIEQRRAVGLERDTWRLEVVADPESDTRIDRPLTIAAGTALDFEGLLRLGEQHGVQFLKGVSCNNLGEPLGMGLWEGVPLRVVVWMARPVLNVRRVYYYGYHNDDPAQMFRSSLPFGRVLEEPPGELPVILCYKLNGQFLTGKRGGPVRMVVPEAYGFKSVKWLQRVVLTNHYAANDTYHQGNNDLDSPMKTFARFVQVPSTAKAGEPIPITGLAQVGVSGLAKVQWWAHQKDAPLPVDDAHFTSAPWQDAEMLPPPTHWGGELPDGRLPGTPLQFDPVTNTPSAWPLRYTIAHWSATLPGLGPGRYDLRCRSIDLNGTAQPMPRPFPKSGRAEIQKVTLTITG
jgi:DMSO/TMAO reductase YedYZ molybdopterin-dependent catalytic subunit